MEENIKTIPQDTKNISRDIRQKSSTKYANKYNDNNNNNAMGNVSMIKGIFISFNISISLLYSFFDKFKELEIIFRG